MDDKPSNLEQYKQWLKENRNVEITDRIKNNYESATDKMKQQLKKSALMACFWTGLEHRSFRGGFCISLV